MKDRPKKERLDLIAMVPLNQKINREDIEKVYDIILTKNFQVTHKNFTIEKEINDYQVMFWLMGEPLGNA